MHETQTGSVGPPYMELSEREVPTTSIRRVTLAPPDTGKAWSRARTVPTEHDGAVEKDEYVRSARHIQDEADCEMERVMHSAMARPWQFGNTAVALGAVMRTALDELTALDPPPTDRAELELHFLRPLRAQADRLAVDGAPIRRNLRLLRFRATAQVTLVHRRAPMSASSLSLVGRRVAGPR
jgi:hypothetical protein